MKFLTTIALLLIVSIPINSQTIDTKNSNVSFSVRNMKIRTVKGTFTGMKGEVIFNQKDLSKSKFNICIDANTINTNNIKRDKHLKNEDFFDVEKFPKICFISKSIQKKKTTYLVNGNLTMHGITKNITIPLQFKNNQFIGSFKVNRTDYKIGGKGGFMVGKEIEISINCKLQ
ncbi:YceI family protein [Tenacibaculum aiptasiae]|uniref:YceI family protein n=1 Tax=Tenacibaculum aiptasiae TaxID=426481 RepID=A0A7J5A9G0_9FLAO|nr:YceI family protein [Tenacibaculum aiptasiae]KAB1154200.1 YceI family protein [Tenacibaculum aiptasiae]